MASDAENSDQIGACRGGDLVLQVYETLRQVAQKMISDERTGHTLQPTALVNEAYLRLGGEKSRLWSTRTHFYHAAAEAMRRVLIDHARSRKRLKRGGPSGKRLPANVLDLVAAPRSTGCAGLGRGTGATGPAEP
jgi:RNA polymerase sigma factor (TIGR02999 family)